MPNTIPLQDVTGSRGESIVKLLLTDYASTPQPLFRLAHLGDKWPVIDYFVELDGVSRMRPYFLIQVKTTSSNLTDAAKSLKISTKKQDIVRLRQFPGPTYILGVHEPTRRVFVRSVHSRTPPSAINAIKVTHELKDANLRILYNEVRDFWRSTKHKPNRSVFA
jgi:hypothetical protein